MSTATAASAPSALAAYAPLLDELGDLKRVRGAASPLSVAALLFAEAWNALVSAGDGLTDDKVDALALATTAQALTAIRLGAIDDATLAAAGLDAAAIATIRARAFDEATGALDATLARELRGQPAAQAAPVAARDRDTPAFVAALAAQPRAGATAPGKRRVLLEPPESHADHCLLTAVYAVLLAPLYGAAPGPPFLLALCHHLHNARLADAGFAGEVVLGDALDTVVTGLTELALTELPAALASRCRAVRTLLTGAEMPAARAFHAADVIDRVLQMHHHARAAGFELAHALDELELVHAGPIQAFHLETLRFAALV